METTSSIYLRPFIENDYKKINIWRNDTEIQRLVSASYRYVSEAIEQEWVKNKMMENQKDLYLAICLKENNEMIGYTSINEIDYINRTAKGGGILLGKEWQNGVERYEAGVLIRSYVFNHLNLNRIEGRCLVNHISSIVTMEASGYVCEGRLRKAIYKNGSYQDQLVFSLLRDEYYRLCEEGEYTLKRYAKRVKKFRNNYRIKEF